MKKGEEKLDPWTVSGEVNYSRIIKNFGVSPISKTLPSLNKEFLFRRGIIFAHRDLDRILEASKSRKKFVMLTGFMPTGKFHIGHMIVAQQIALWQSLGAKIYIAIADLEAYHARGQSLEESRRIALEEYIPNYLAFGVDIKKADIYFQSARSQEYEKSNAYYRLASFTASHITENEFKAIYGDFTSKKLIASLLQTSDILHAQLPEFENPCPVIVPVGIDQDPHLRLTRDIANRLKSFKFVLPSSTYHLFMPGLKGAKSKMSSSDETSYIALTDNPEVVKRKINKYAFSGGRDTLEQQRKHGANPDIDVSFQYLRMFFEQDDNKLQKIYDEYKSGKMTTGELKAYTIDKINSFLKQHQIKIKSAHSEIKKIFS